MSERVRYSLPVAVFMVIMNNQNEILMLQRANTGWMDNLPDQTIDYVRFALENIAKGEGYGSFGWQSPNHHKNLKKTLDIYIEN